ncbi:arginine deiminase-related protein [Bdellovibrio sp. SKB1291214]|uniref:dimethylarginine dimethylaminohydrolase family protein n=1 Tax=Bdellovibrio sp. SKB1291214 TaxID=1732569 RepID=UPI0015951E8A|nr:arginine deiminase-related protein [Bdellovibrio sp. SKB1291214]UYL07879.1 arginine deiminase-related protein [Bdellovibrio sp. SKB1291214]
MKFVRTLKECGANVMVLPFIHGAFDSVFMKDSAILKSTSKGLSALVTRLRCEQREVEAIERRTNLEKRGIHVWGQASSHLEGGDVVAFEKGQKIFMGHGFRSDRAVTKYLEKFFDCEVIPLELKDPNFYHLDVALAILQDGTAFACKDAFTAHSWEILNNSGLTSVIPVSRQETMSFGLNWVEIGDSVIVGSYVPRMSEILKAMGKTVRHVPLDQFQLAGGSAACLTSKAYDLESSAKGALMPLAAVDEYMYSFVNWK